MYPHYTETINLNLFTFARTINVDEFTAKQWKIMKQVQTSGKKKVCQIDLITFCNVTACTLCLTGTCEAGNITFLIRNMLI